MNLQLLQPHIQQYIQENLNTPISSILLKGTSFDGVSTLEIVNQIEAKKKAKNKLYSWYKTKDIYYPNKISIEQSSSEKTAIYKAGLVSGKHLVDTTGGFGVDALYFSKNMAKVTHCEYNQELSAIASHNTKVLKKENISCISGDSFAFLETQNTPIDWVYSDPARRSSAKEKVFLLSDCTPNIVEKLPFLWQKTKQILIKTSPILDIKNGVRELKNVAALHVVALENEVKELLWILKKDTQNTDFSITCVNLKKDSSAVFTTTFLAETTAIPLYGAPKKYLYEPNAAILKAGAFNAIASNFNLEKLHQHSHIYTSEDKIEFPGRCFTIQEQIPYNKKELKKRFGASKANITTRNFPESVAIIRKKLNIKEGGALYLFFTTNHLHKKIVLVCEKVS